MPTLQSLTVKYLHCIMKIQNLQDRLKHWLTVIVGGVPSIAVNYVVSLQISKELLQKSAD